MDKKNDKSRLINALKELSSFKIVSNKNKMDIEDNPGWHESEEEYKKAQRDWLKKVKKRKK